MTHATPDTPVTTQWSLMPRFVLRSAGFPFAGLEALAFPNSVEAAERVLAAHRESDQQRRRFLDVQFPRICDEETAAGRERATFRQLYQAARRVRHDASVDDGVIDALDAALQRPALTGWLRGWNRDHASAARLAHDLERVLDDELRERRAALRDALADPRVREALWLSNPSIHEVALPSYDRRWDPDRRPAKMRYLERSLYAYLQRLCAKNDTTSFFGPIGYGTFTADATPTLRLASTPVRRRRAFFAYRGAAALAAAIAREPELRLHLRPSPVPARTGAPHQPELAAAHAACDGTRTVASVAVRLSCGPAHCLRVVEQLAADGWVTLAPPIPPAVLDPIAHLQALVHDLPACDARDRWSRRLQWFATATRRFANARFDRRRELLAEIEARYTELVGDPPRRGAGGMYEDRVLVHEECLGDIEQLTLTAAQRAWITERLAPVATLAASYSARRLDDWHHAVHELFTDLSPHGAPLPFVRFARAWRRRHPKTPATPTADRLVERLTALVERTPGPVRSLDAADVAALCGPVTHPVVLSPDIMLDTSTLDADPDRLRVVVGEIHHGVQLMGWFQAFVDDPDAWWDELGPHLGVAEGEISATLIFGRRMKTAPPELGDVSIEVSAPAAAPVRAQVRDLDVQLYEGRLTLFLRRGAVCVEGTDHTGPVRLLPPSYGVPEDSYAPFAVFSTPLVELPPVDLGTHTPRIEIAGAVVQRARWRVPTSELPTLAGNSPPSAALLAALELKHRRGLPRHVFVRSPTEPKPVHVDLHGLFAVETLVQLGTHTDTLLLEEMAPGPQGMWLGAAGARRACELRTVLSTCGASRQGDRR